MKITKKVTHTTEIECLIDVICNKCGGSCVPVAYTRSLGEGTPVKFNEETGEHEAIPQDEYMKQCELRGPDAYGLVEATVSSGYFSDPLLDGQSYTFSLCESCLDKLFKTFKVPVQVVDPW